jgi:hypothetical protein
VGAECGGIFRGVGAGCGGDFARCGGGFITTLRCVSNILAEPAPTTLVFLALISYDNFEVGFYQTDKLE